MYINWCCLLGSNTPRHLLLFLQYSFKAKKKTVVLTSGLKTKHFCPGSWWSFIPSRKENGYCSWSIRATVSNDSKAVFINLFWGNSAFGKTPQNLKLQHVAAILFCLTASWMTCSLRAVALVAACHPAARSTLSSCCWPFKYMNEGLCCCTLAESSQWTAALCFPHEGILLLGFLFLSTRKCSRNIHWLEPEFYPVSIFTLPGICMQEYTY